MATSCHHFLCYNNIIEEDDDTLPSSSFSLQHHLRRRRWQCAIVFFFSNTKKKKHKKKQQKKIQEKGRSLPSSFCSALSLLALTSTLLFQMFSPSIFFFSSKRKEKNKKETIEKKRNAEKGESFPSSSHSTLSFLAPASTFPLLPFYFKRFLLASSCSQAEEKKKKQRKENHKEKKKCREGRELSLSSDYALSLLALASTLLLLPFYFKHFILTSSSSQA